MLILKRVTKLEYIIVNPSDQTIEQPVLSTPPTDVRYKNVIAQLLLVAGRHKRNTLLTGLVGSLPLLLAFACVFVLAYLTPHSKNTTDSYPAWSGVVIVIMVILFFVAPFWMAVVNRIAHIQQVLWVKSFFDNNASEDKASLKRALRLFWPGIRLSLNMFIRYYWSFWLVVVVFYSITIYSIVQNTNTTPPNDGLNTLLFMLLIFSPLVVLVAYFFLSQFVSLRTRYVPIIFVTTYGQPGFSYAHLFEENHRISQLDASHGKSFGELLLLATGVDTTVTSVPGSVASASATTVSAVGGKVGQAAGTLGMMYGSEIAALSETLAQTIIYYMYYLAATTSSIGERD